MALTRLSYKSNVLLRAAYYMRVSDDVFAEIVQKNNQLESITDFLGSAIGLDYLAEIKNDSKGLIAQVFCRFISNTQLSNRYFFQVMQQEWQNIVLFHAGLKQYLQKYGQQLAAQLLTLNNSDFQLYMATGYPTIDSLAVFLAIIRLNSLKNDNDNIQKLLSKIFYFPPLLERYAQLAAYFPQDKWIDPVYFMRTTPDELFNPDWLLPEEIASKISFVKRKYAQMIDIINEKAFLWKAEKNGHAALYIFNTVQPALTTPDYEAG